MTVDFQFHHSSAGPVCRRHRSVALPHQAAGPIVLLGEDRESEERRVERSGIYEAGDQPDPGRRAAAERTAAAAVGDGQIVDILPGRARPQARSLWTLRQADFPEPIQRKTLR